MTLLELCDPLFQHVCRLSRGARKGASPDLVQVRGEIKGLLADMLSRARGTPGLQEQYAKIEIILLYFIDFMIKESRLPFARQWQELAHERNKLAGDEDFFDELDRTLAEPDTESSRNRLSIFYTCMGLGFTGWYTGNPEHLRRKMNEIASRIRGLMDADKAAKVCPEAYEHVNTADLVEPPTRKLIGVGLLIAGLGIAVFVVSLKMYSDSRATIGRSLDWIVQNVGPGGTSNAETGGGVRK